MSTTTPEALTPANAAPESVLTETPAVPMPLPAIAAAEPEPAAAPVAESVPAQPVETTASPAPEAAPEAVPEAVAQAMPEFAAITPALVDVDAPTTRWSLGGIALVALLVGALLTSIGVYSYFHFGQKKVVATGSVAKVTLYPIKATIMGNGISNGRLGANESYTQMLVFAQIQVHNQSPDPLTITDMVGDITLPDEELHGDGQPSSPAASHNDYNRLFGAYKRLAPLRSDPLLRDTVIAPNQTAGGQLIFNYSLTKETWEKRKSFLISVSFSNGTTIQIDGTHAGE